MPDVSSRTAWIALLILPAIVAFACAIAWSLSVPLADDPAETLPSAPGVESSSR